MCGRFVITSPPAAVRLAFGYLDQPNFPARYNVAPTQPIPVVIVDQGTRRFALMRWGLIPSWVKDPRQFSLLINARAETVLDKPAFRSAMKRRRCLVPADGYYEWQRAGARKQPFFIHPRDGTVLGLAALAETWVGPNGEELDTVAIITAAASEAMAVLHDRVPVAIDPADIERWLDCAAVTRRGGGDAAARAGGRRTDLAPGLDRGEPRRQRQCATDFADRGGAERGSRAAADGEEGSCTKTGATAVGQRAGLVVLSLYARCHPSRPSPCDGTSG